MSSMFQQFGAGLRAFEAPLDARMRFVRRTYLHLSGAVLAFASLCWGLHAFGVGARMAEFLTAGRLGWMIFLGAFMLVAWLASSMAHSPGSLAKQYAGLFLYTVAEAFIFAPIVWIAAAHAPRGTIATAGLVTAIVFGGLSAFVLVTRKDFSFLRTFLFVGGLVALGLIGASLIFGFNLGLVFSGAMILFASVAILYSTSKVLHRYRTDQYVAASLELFAAVALLFYYVLLFLLQSQRR